MNSFRPLIPASICEYQCAGLELFRPNKFQMTNRFKLFEEPNPFPKDKWVYEQVENIDEIVLH